MARYEVELRSTAIEGDRLVGHAAVFGRMAEMPDHWEQLAPGAFDEVLAAGPDVRALINHDPNLLLARTANGTLELDTDDDGLVFRAELPDTSYARDLRELVSRGLVSGASFGFVPGKVSTGTAPDGRRLRTHTSVARLLDVSAVTYPAYEATDVALRSVDFSPDIRRRNRNLTLAARAVMALKGTRWL